MTTLVKQLRVFGGKQETAPGVKETLTATECAYNAYDVMVQPVIEQDKRLAVGGFGNTRGRPGGRLAKMTFKHDLEFSGLAVPTFADLLFPACGLVKTGNIFKPKTQTPDTPSATVKTITLGCYMAGKFIGVYGAMGTVKYNAPTNKIPFFEFEFTGILDPEVDVAVPAPTYPTRHSLTARGGPVSFATVPLCLESFTFDLANTLYPKMCPSNDNGYEFAIVTQRDPKFTGNPESKLVASQDRLGMLLGATEGVLRHVVPAAGYNSGTGAKSFEIRCDQAQIVEKQEGDRDGVSTDELNWQANNAAVDSDVQLIFNI